MIVPSCLKVGRPLRPWLVMSSLHQSWEEAESDIEIEGEGSALDCLVRFDVGSCASSGSDCPIDDVE